MSRFFSRHQRCATPTGTGSPTFNFFTVHANLTPMWFIKRFANYFWLEWLLPSIGCLIFLAILTLLTWGLCKLDIDETACPTLENRWLHPPRSGQALYDPNRVVGGD